MCIRDRGGGKEARGVVVDHNFAATSHFKGAHDGIGGLAKNKIRTEDPQARRIHDTNAAYELLRAYVEEWGTKKGGPFADWYPNNITRYHVKLVGAKEIPRPPVDLKVSREVPRSPSSW